MSAKKQTFEQEIARLEEIVAALEKGDAPLADSLALLIFCLPARKAWTRWSRPGQM